MPLKRNTRCETRTMANIYHNDQPATGLTAVLGLTLQRAETGYRLANAIGQFLDGAVSRFSAWNEARRTREILSKLSAHELDDIGLNRGDIDRIANRSNY